MSPEALAHFWLDTYTYNSYNTLLLTFFLLIFFIYVSA